MSERDTLVLETAADTLGFDPQTGCLTSFRRKAAPEQEFIASTPEHPAFVIAYLDGDRRYRLLSSQAAEQVQVRIESGREDETRILAATYRRLDGLDLDVTFWVCAGAHEAMSHWSISLRNDAGLEIVDVQFPFLVCAYELGGSHGSEAIVLPHGYGSGRLITNPGAARASGGAWKMALAPDNWRAWALSRVAGHSNHYPGTQFAQFLAYYSDRAGIYLACDDTAGNVKRFAALHRDPGIRLGVAHIGDWPSSGERRLEYDILLGSFEGDWYAAAGLYRDWTLAQPWAVPLHRRRDVPAWLLDSPVYITIRPQGVLDEGPVFPVDEFFPYEKCIPLLEQVAARVQAPVVAMFMGWESAGSWIYPDSLPPIGGEASLTEFSRQARARGWHVGTFSNGSRWVVGHRWNGYDGWPYFEQHGGAQSICREADGTMWQMGLDAWRQFITCCLGTGITREMAVDWVRHLIAWGLEALQFFDQNHGAATFPCFAADHEHPPVPGKWMAAKMRQVMEQFRSIAAEAGEHEVIQSAESGVNEYCLPLFQQTELRVFPPGYGVDVIPLYQFLFHECITIQGMMGNAPEPYHLPIRNAVNCVLGGIPGGVLTGDGTLLGRDTNNWAPWEPKVGNDEDALEMMRTVTALRRGPGRDFLVFGRMLAPAQVEGIETMRWHSDAGEHRIPAVFHSAWEAADGRFGVVIANWTASEQKVCVRDERLTGPANLVAIGRQLTSTPVDVPEDGQAVPVPPLGCALLIHSNTH